MTGSDWGSYDPAPNAGRPDPSAWSGPGGSHDRLQPTSALPSVGPYDQPGGSPPPQYPQPAYPQPGYPQPGYPQPGPPQPGQPQPGYEPTGRPPGGYGQPGGYPPGAYQQPSGHLPGPYPTGGHGSARATTRAPGTAGIAVAGVGALIAVLGLFLNWYAAASAHVGLKQLVQASKLAGAPGLFHVYFGWALWVVLAAGIAVALSANLAGSSVAPLAIGGAVLGVLSTVLTFAALNSARTSGGPLDHAAIGLWLFLLGPLVLGAGALVAVTRPAR